MCTCITRFSEYIALQYMQPFMLFAVLHMFLRYVNKSYCDIKCEVRYRAASLIRLILHKVCSGIIIVLIP